jgi:carbonic anhydrase
MSCKNGAPVNIKNFEALKNAKSLQCKSILCNFYYNFSNCDCLITNKGAYLDINCCKNGNSLSYNGNDLTVQNVRLYMKSVNKYDDLRFDGELMIFCVGGSRLPSLILCIPIKKGSSNTSSAKWFSKFSNNVPNDGEQYTVNVSNYTLNSVIPQCGFAEYTGALNLPPCNSKGKVLFFDPSYHINIKPSDYDKIKAHISRSLESTHASITNNSNNILWNKKGTSNGPGKTVKSKSDEYILDCTQTIDENGNPVQKDSRSRYPSAAGININMTSKQMWWMLGGFLALVIILLIKYLILPGGQKLYNSWKARKNAKKASPAMAGGGTYKRSRRRRS